MWRQGHVEFLYSGAPIRLDKLVMLDWPSVISLQWLFDRTPVLCMQDYQLINHAYNLIGSFKHVTSKPFHVLPVSQRSCSLSVLCYHHRVPPSRLRSSAKQNKTHGRYFLVDPRTLQAAQVARVVFV